MVYCKVCNREYHEKALSRHMRTAVHQRNAARVNDVSVISMKTKKQIASGSEA